MTLFAVLPAYNEAEDLPALLQRYRAVTASLREPLRVIVVDDASTDDTVSRARAVPGLDLTILRHERNQGLGGALWTGLSHAARWADGQDDIILTMDADNTHDPAYIPAIVEAIRRDGCDVVVASRYAQGGHEVGVPGYRKVLSHGAAWFYRTAYRLPNLRDYSCGYRGFRAAVLRQAFADLGAALIRERGFQATGEIILNLRHYTSKFGEVAFDLHYEQKHGASKMRPLRVAIDTLRCLWRLRRKPVPTPQEKAAYGA